MSGFIFMAAAKLSLFLTVPVKSVFVYCWIHFREISLFTAGFIFTVAAKLSLF